MPEIPVKAHWKRPRKPAATALLKEEVYISSLVLKVLKEVSLVQLLGIKVFRVKL